MSSKQSLKALEEINIFCKDNKQLRSYFFFFFLVAICGYASIMLSLCPSNDDYCRYILNKHVGSLDDARYLSIIIECFLYFSHIITDAAPFSQIISCALLAYVAVVFAKILIVDIDDKYSILCLAPLVVNPYILECMMFRFDNPFMMLALLCSVFSAYLACFNEKRLVFMQSALLLQSLFLYQPASSAYFVICIYFLLVDLTSDKSLISLFKGMRYRVYTPIITLLFYLPFVSDIRYSREKSGNIFLIPTSFENIKRIFENIFCYVRNLETDWFCNTSGKIFFFLLVVFSVFFIVDVFKNINNKITALYRSIFIAILLTIFFISPLGVCAFLCSFSFEGNTSIYPRILYCFGILLSLVLYKNYQFIKRYEIFKKIYVGYLCCFGVWNIVFLNSSGNVIHCYRKLQQFVFYDLTNDVHDILKLNNKFTHFCIQGAVSSQAMQNFSQVYPILDRIIPEKSYTPHYCILALLSHQILYFTLKYMPMSEHLKKTKYLSKKLLKNHLWYDIYSLDEKILLFQLKKDVKFGFNSPMMRVRPE